MVTTREIAKAAGIAPRTKHVVMRDEFGLAYEGGPCDHVLAAIVRGATASPDLGIQVTIAAVALHKCYVTGRMNVHFARVIREQRTPYQVCAVVAAIVNGAGESATIGFLADQWINENANTL